MPANQSRCRPGNAGGAPGLAGLEAGRFGGWVLRRRSSKMVRGCTIGMPEGAVVK